MNWFKRTMLVGALAASTLIGCSVNQGGAGTTASGSLSISKDNAFLYAADTDNGILAIVDVKSKTKIAEVKVGKEPVRVLVGNDETIFVANRGDRSVSVITKGNWVEAKRLAVGIEPSGMALTADGKTLLVISATSKTNPEVGTLTGFDTASLEQKFELDVGAEPRAVAVLNNNRALVSFFRNSDVAEIDLNTVKVTKSGTDLAKLANASRKNVAVGSSSGGSSTFAAHGMTDLIATPDGNRVFAPVVWSREDVITRRPTTAGGYYAAGGPCNIGSVATAGIVTIETQGSPTPKVDDLTACSSGSVVNGNEDYPVTTLATRSTGGLNTVQGPSVGVTDPTGTWLFVVNRESQNLAVLPTYRRQGADLDFDTTGSSIRNTVGGIGAGADGIALTSDGAQAYVYSQFDHQIVLIEAKGAGNNSFLENKGVIAVVAKDTLSPDMAEGRRLFFDAMDTRMSSESTNVACSTCHLDGRDDGHVWQFPDGARQTPVLAGRKLLSTGPWHWSGEFATLEKFNVHTITERMGGRGLGEDSTKRLNSYIDGLPKSDNPIRTSMTSEVASRGRVAFEKANCATCHAGALLTDNRNVDVGTLRLGKVSNPDNGPVVQTGFNVPSLIGVGRSAPYLHDGSQATLEERIFASSGSLHGNVAVLSQAEKTDLVTYLKSL